MYTSCNLFSHFQPVFLAPVQQKQTGCRICNPAPPITSRQPAHGHSSTVPSSTKRRGSPVSLLHGRRGWAKIWQLFGNPGVILPLPSSAPGGNLPANQFLCYFSALGGTAALPRASRKAGDLPGHPAKATGERTGETSATTASVAFHEPCSCPSGAAPGVPRFHSGEMEAPT